MKRVLIIEPEMKQYRVPFYTGLYEALSVDGIELNVAYHDPPPSDPQKKDNCDLAAEYALRAKAPWLFKKKLSYQRLFGSLSVRTHIPEFHMILVGGGPDNRESFN